MEGKKPEVEDEEEGFGEGEVIQLSAEEMKAIEEQNKLEAQLEEERKFDKQGEYLLLGESEFFLFNYATQSWQVGDVNERNFPGFFENFSLSSIVDKGARVDVLVTGGYDNGLA